MERGLGIEGRKQVREGRGLQAEEHIHQRGSEDQKPAVLVVEEMKILLVWWYGGMVVCFSLLNK